MSEPGYFSGSLAVPVTPHQSPSWPALAATSGAALAGIAAVIGLTADDAGHRTTAGVLGFVIGAMLVSIAWNVHRALDTRARQVGARRRRVLGLDAGTLASASMWIGLVAGLVSAFAVATELAK